MWSLRLLLLAIMGYILYKLWKNEPIQKMIRPFDTVYKETPNSIIQNKLFSSQTTPFNAYEWQDVHVQGFYGEQVIDVTQTVLPKGTSFISIRQSLGKVTIYVPYEIPVRLHYRDYYWRSGNLWSWSTAAMEPICPSKRWLFRGCHVRFGVSHYCIHMDWGY